MKPLPTPDVKKGTPREMPSLPLKTDPGSYSVSNKKITHCSVRTLYPWLLFASTTVAATFCLAYITKPVIVSNPNPPSTSTTRIIKQELVTDKTSPSDPSEKIIPDSSVLPGEPTPASLTNVPPASPLASDFEETNVRVQHILDAKSPTGDMSRIVLDVPVLYQSRNLRWSQQEAAEARILLSRLSEYQLKARDLREEGTTLLEDWNNLMEKSIPVQALRADSPSLPSNQQDSPLAPRRMEAANSIQLQTTDQ